MLYKYFDKRLGVKQMRGKVAKRIRREVFGNMAFKPKTIPNKHLHKLYKLKKREHYALSQ